MPGRGTTSKKSPPPLALGPNVDLPRLLADLTGEQSSGELVVRSPDGTGRVYLAAGRIAWAFVADAPLRFTSRLVDGGFVARGDVEEVVTECRRSGGNFCETLILWGLVAREPLRTLLRDYVAEGLARIVAWRTPQALFVPQSRNFLSDLTFSLDELLPPPQPAQPESRGLSRDVSPTPHVAQTESLMKNVKSSLDDAMGIDGAIGAAIVDYESGMALGTAGGGADFPVEIAAAGNTDVVRAKMRVAQQLGLPGSIEDMLITLSTQYHLIRPLRSQPGLFFYVALDRAKANLGMARFRLAQIETNVTM